MTYSQNIENSQPPEEPLNQSFDCLDLQPLEAVVFSESWVKSYRKIKEHWIWENPVYFKIWQDFIFTANIKSKKVRIGARIFDCERGQFITTYEKIAKDHHVGIQYVRTFLKLLKNDGMVNVENIIKATRITIINYNTYQDKKQQNNFDITSTQHDANTHATSTQQQHKNIKNIRNKEDKNKPADKKDFISVLLQIFCNEYYSLRNLEYIPVKGRDRQAIGSLLREFKTRHTDFDSAKTETAFRQFFVKCLNIKDNWLHANMTPALIYSKYNEIQNNLYKGNKNDAVFNEYLENQRKWNEGIEGYGF